MAHDNPRTIEDLEEEARLLQAKLTAIEEKKLELVRTEGVIRTDMLRVDNQLVRLKKIHEKTPD